MGDIEDYDAQLRDYVQLSPAQQARFRARIRRRASAERQKAIAAFFNACARGCLRWLRFGGRSNRRDRTNRLKMKPDAAPVAIDPK
nr:hypothetical protein [uncultured Dongia sp.]